MKKSITLLTIALGLVGLASCSAPEPIKITSNDDGTATVKIFRNQDSTLDECYIAPSNVDVDITYQTLSGLLSNNQTVCPSTGDVNLLVIPVHLPGGDEYKTDQVKEDIQKVFFGSKDDADLGYPSLAEYYRTSSYGKLNFSGTVTDWFDVTEHTSITSIDQVTGGSNGTIMNVILRSAIEWAIDEQGINPHEFDSNEDGFFDGIWMVYDHLDMTLLGEYNSALWNMTSWDWESYKDEEFIQKQVEWGVGTSGFSWASFDMMYTSYCEVDENSQPILDDLDSIKLSSHTYIHETGHLLGLEDLYSTDSSVYRPSGQYTMMDQNVGDLDTFSKMLLGWVKPYVAYGPSQILLQDTSVNDHQAIVIPANYQEINAEVERQTNLGVNPTDITIEFNPFSEYILIDLYAPTGNNVYDVENPINGRNPGSTKAGVRIYHADMRIFKCHVTTDGTLLFNQEDYVWNGEQLSSSQAIFTVITNNQGIGNIDINSYLGDRIGVDFNAFDALRLIEASGQNTFNYGGYFSDTTMWDTESRAFNIYTYGLQFFPGTSSTFNDGTSLPFSIQVTTLKEVAND